MAGKADKKGKSDKDGGFLSRWSERKRGGAAAETQPAPNSEDTNKTEDEKAWSEEEVQAKLAEVEAMKQGDDFKPLLAGALPEVVKRAALRKLWRSNPVFGILDGLNDYDLDYTIKPGVVENLRSAYQAGKGYVYDEEEESRRQAEIAGRREKDKQRDLERAQENAKNAQDAATETAESAPQGESEAEVEPGRDEAPASSDGKETKHAADKPRGGAAARRWGGESA